MPSAWTHTLLAARKYDVHPLNQLLSVVAFVPSPEGRVARKWKHKAFTCYIEISRRFPWSAGSFKKFCGLRNGNNIEMSNLNRVVSLCLMFLAFLNGNKTACQSFVMTGDIVSSTKNGRERFCRNIRVSCCFWRTLRVKFLKNLIEKFSFGNSFT